MAVVDLGVKTLLIWQRTSKTASDSEKAADATAFDTMLGSLRFADRAVEHTAPAPDRVTPVDETWTASWTFAELKASPLLMGPEELNDENWGQDTLTLSKGQGRESRVNPKKTTSASFRFTVDGDTITLAYGSDVFVMRWSVTGGELKFTRDPPLGIAPTPYVLKPYVRATGGDVLQGNWATARIPAAAWVAANRRGGATPAEANEFWAQFGTGPNTGDGRAGLRLDGDGGEVLEAFGAEPLEHGVDFTYQITKPGRMVLRIGEGCLIELTYQVTGRRLQMQPVGVTAGSTDTCRRNDYPAVSTLLGTAPLNKA